MNVADLVLMTNAVATVRDRDQFLAEGTDNKLSGRFLTVGLFLNDVGNSFAIRRIEGLIKLVEKIKGSRVAACTNCSKSSSIRDHNSPILANRQKSNNRLTLNCKNKSQGHQSFLTT